MTFHSDDRLREIGEDLDDLAYELARGEADPEIVAALSLYMQAVAQLQGMQFGRVVQLVEAHPLPADGVGGQAVDAHLGAAVRRLVLG